MNRLNPLTPPARKRFGIRMPLMAQAQRTLPNVIRKRFQISRTVRLRSVWVCRSTGAAGIDPASRSMCSLMDSLLGYDISINTHETPNTQTSKHPNPYPPKPPE
jgi:hypothetical protein